MKKIIYLVCFATLFLSSCSSDSSQSTAAEDDVLVKEVWTDNDTNPIHFNYDGKKFVSTNYDGEDRYYTYTGDLITKIQTYNNGNGLGYGLRVESLFTYDTSGRLTEHVFKSIPDANNIDYTITTTFVYNSNNTISVVKTIGYPTLAFSYVPETRLIHLSGTTIISEDTSVYNTTGGFEYGYTTSYNYDTKNNPFKNVIGYKEIYLAEDYVFCFDHLSYLHNIVASDEITVTYTYNSLNFPVTAATTSVSEPQIPPSMTHYIYY
ncbi:hypothetical protein [Flavobacterium terrisoli]|uniref:hypothetical protein n=1 Tax=Flavobacterium terrisoli TaxID=3242195 RepID=UPI002542EFA2|nr:hypothetical protein [Flavobacterium buctense]